MTPLPSSRLAQTHPSATSVRRAAASRAWTVLLLGLVLGTVGASPAQAQLVIRKDTTISQSFRAEGGLVVEAGATLTFDPHRSVTVESVGNVVVYGTLRIAPASADVRDTLRIVGADEAGFVGGHTNQPLETDRGLWVLGGGRLDVRGTPKTPWAPRPMLVEGWLPGDDVRIAPHAPGEFERFERAPRGFHWPTAGSPSLPLPEASKRGIEEHLGAATLAQVERARRTSNGRAPAVAWPVSDLGHVDPLLRGVYPELLNLTRNVVIEGQPGARSHILIHTSQPVRHVVKYAEIKHMGPRFETGKRTHRGTRAVTRGYMGRYPLHFHMNMNRSRGSLVEGVVIRQSGHRAFVTHGSHGIRLEGTIAFDVFDSGYWWDPVKRGHAMSASHDITINRAVAALVKCDRGDAKCYSQTAGFVFQDGSGNAVTNSVAVGVQGLRGAAGFSWPESADSPWTFENNLAHNNRATGIFVWQNNGAPDHFVRGYTAYHNDMGVHHGAYGNSYHYEGLTLVENRIGIRLHASSDGSQTWKDVRIRGGEVGIQGRKRVKPPRSAVLFQNGSVERAAQPIALDDEEGVSGIDAVPHAPARWRFEGWDLAPDDIDVSRGTELYRGARGEMLFRDYGAGPAVYRDLLNPASVYGEGEMELYFADYSTRNAPPFLVEMVSSVQVVNGARSFELRGRSGEPIPLLK